MIRAVLFDRDGTLIADEPKSATVTPMPFAREALEVLRRSGIRIGVATNQPRIADGTLSAAQLQETHRQIEEQLGAIDAWFVCGHAPADACACRKPQPGLIEQAAREFHLITSQIAMIGDIGSDIDAARAAGALPILVPTPVTLAPDIESANVVCGDLLQAVEVALAYGAAA